ncbi:hypothetical protein J5A66_07510 [Prevotella sp. oral taxon 475]|uniref:hypothetical protein n=1 Tax=Prevotella sp. oral taxon 475 TaxID=712471 RepID=UPI001BADD1A8|nr:hypothetical protein [Prevotella sp. oral taxon 475]QUB46819.1 hypothetical protein J5A66_07510 [Prevotella sp. oral taxon 475]
MKRRFNLLPCAAFALALMFSACSHNDEPTPNNAPLISLGSDATFTLTEEKFETSKPTSMPASRAMAAQAQPQEVDLGDGLHATMSIEEDSEPETRANPISQGRYSIYALDGSGNRITGTHKTLTGEVNASGKFVPDASSMLELPAGTYTFVCISEGVTDNGTSLSITNSTKKPMLGKTIKTISNADRHVSFAMKHLTARVRFKYVVYTTSTNNVSLKLATRNATAPSLVTYDVKGDKTNETAGLTQTADGIAMPATLTEMDTKYPLAHRTYTDYFYILPGTISNDIISAFVGGEIYSGYDMTNKIGYYQTTPPITFATNKSYTITMYLHPLLYLFNDGSNGVLSEKGSRTPIGIVTREKTNTSEGTAVGLKASPMALEWETAAGIGQQRNTTVHDTWWNGTTGSGSELNGYDLTWTGTGTTDGKKRAEEPTQYPAFRWVSTYNPGVSTSNIGKWYIPALGEIFASNDNNNYDIYGQFYHYYGGAAWSTWGGTYGGSFNPSVLKRYDDASYNTEMFDAFTNAGGALPDKVFVWTSSTSDGNTGYRPLAVIFSTTSLIPPMFPGDTQIHTIGAKALEKNTADVHVLPFVHF